jgi:hypothetical protein
MTMANRRTADAKRMSAPGSNITSMDDEPTQVDGQRPPEDAASGSEAAPTKRAEDRERERHSLERQIGRTAAGTAGAVKDTRRADVTRKDLDEAAKEADRRVAGHEIDGSGRRS